MGPKSFVALTGVELLPIVAARLESAMKGLGWSKSHIVNDSLIRTLGLEGLGLSDDQVWGPKTKRKETDEKEVRNPVARS
jgi:hypothetical protein